MGRGLSAEFHDRFIASLAIGFSQITQHPAPTAAPATSDPTESLKSAARWRLRFWALGTLALVFAVASSFAAVRGWVMAPLYVHDEQASGEVAYVMADGPATWERLRAVADLYHMDRIEQVALLNEQRSAGYNFVRHNNDTRLQREIDFLDMLGVPADVIRAIDADPDDWLSSRSEAAGLYREMPDLERLVVVTSPPHTRRSLLCFKRLFSTRTEVTVYAAAKPSESVETHLPIWIEYVKLAVYWLAV